MHPIIALWSHPRSMSTAIERIMRERGDCTCFHEPFMYDYYVHRRVREMPHFDVEVGRPQSYADVRSDLLEAALSGPVFIKDMSYYVVPQLFDDRAFARRITHSFLIRDPLKSILSYFKLDDGVTLEEIGLEAQWLHFDWLVRELGIDAPVVIAESVQEAPDEIIGRWWREIGLSPCPGAFQWSSEELPQDWGQVEGWHGSVSGSRGIQRSEPESAQAREEKFARAAQQAPQLARFLEHHRPFYERLRALALTPPGSSVQRREFDSNGISEREA